MLRNLVLGSVIAGFCVAMVGSASADDRISASKKGSLLIYSKVELKWNFVVGDGYVLSQDTFLDLSNDYPDYVNVQFYFVNGDEPLEQVCVPNAPIPCEDADELERAHPGWNWVDCEVPLTPNQPTYMSMFSGLPAGCQPFTELDPGFPPGRPDPEVRGGRYLRGFVYAWAVDNDDAGDSQNRPIRWNHLTGDALIINYALATAAEYNAYAAQVVERVGGPAHGDFVGVVTTVPGGASTTMLNLDGVDYDLAFQRLLMDFYGSGSLALSGDARIVVLDTDITLHAVSADLRQETNGPIKTKAVFNIWNENERRFSGTEKCIECWDQTLASNYPAPNHLLVQNLQTNKGKARIEGIASNIAACPLAVDAALLGIQIKELTFFRLTLGGPVVDGFARSAINMVGQGEKEAKITYDLVAGSDEANNVTGAAVDTAGMKSDRGGR